MADVAWLLRRLKAMSIPEVKWRLSQKSIQNKEEAVFKSRASAVTQSVNNPDLQNLSVMPERLFLNLDNADYTLNDAIPLLGGYDYKEYRKKWNAGFQTDNSWPDEFSYKLEYKQRDDIGDARTNWELNRHFQFALLAKDYFASGEKRFLDEFSELFYDWNQKNAFLHGISWTSVMEVAIRVSNWCYSYCFLSESKEVPSQLLEDIRTGIINMTDYVAQHYSRYSSANNHLIVEAYAVGQSGVLLDYQPWIDLSVKLLTKEFPLQNYADGVNKELSLHYQSFYMEAVGLMMRLLVKNNYPVPGCWSEWLEKMCKYVADCSGAFGEIIEFGDNDEGKILDLSGAGFDHYRYVLGLLSCLLSKNYDSLDGCAENLCWLFTEQERIASDKKPQYRPSGSVCYKEGGNTILRSNDGRVLIGIDHAALGFGSIAAHGHADALSFQMFVDGKPVFIDPGTYIYHCDIESRNEFRKTCNHNTVCVGGKDQSEMLGAFLWGKKAECTLEKYEDGSEVTLTASQNGYSPCIHTRTFVFDKDREFTVKDSLSKEADSQLLLLTAPGFSVEALGGNAYLLSNHNTKIKLTINGSHNEPETEACSYSSAYGFRQAAKKLAIGFRDEIELKIVIEE